MATPDQRRERLAELYNSLRDHDCPLRESPTKLVFGAGSGHAHLRGVGGAPGAQEDRVGLPVVGPAGKLVEGLLGEMGMEREDGFINSCLMCRPPGIRAPLPEEIEECR